MTARLKFIALAICIAALAACDRIDSTRIPIYPVNLDLGTTGYWVTYGVHSYGEYRTFIREKRLPSNFPFTANTYTGFGGILLISGYNFVTQDYNTPLAYDLACPVEAKNSVIVTIDPKTFDAICPTCGSHFNVVEGGGTPTSGPALQKKFGLQRYVVTASISGGFTVTR